PCSSVRLLFSTPTSTTDIYTLSLHDALPISRRDQPRKNIAVGDVRRAQQLDVLIHRVERAPPEFRRAARSLLRYPFARPLDEGRSEEHTSELQSLTNLVCRLLL